MELDDILAVGGWKTDNIKAEMYNEVSNAWTALPDYPYSGMRLPKFY